MSLLGMLRGKMFLKMLVLKFRAAKRLVLSVHLDLGKALFWLPNLITSSPKKIHNFSALIQVPRASKRKNLCRRPRHQHRKSVKSSQADRSCSSRLCSFQWHYILQHCLWQCWCKRRASLRSCTQSTAPRHNRIDAHGLRHNSRRTRSQVERRWKAKSRHCSSNFEEYPRAFLRWSNQFSWHGDRKLDSGTNALISPMCGLFDF